METSLVTTATQTTLFLKPSFAVAVSQSGELQVHVEAEHQAPVLQLPVKPAPRN